METTTELKDTNPAGYPPVGSANDNAMPRAARRSEFPDDVVARIYKPSRSVLTSGKGRTRGWRLVFERRTPQVIEPLIGYTGGDDTLTQVELSFPTLNSALRYAERQGLTYTVRGAAKDESGQRSSETKSVPVDETRSSRAFSDTTLNRLGLAALQQSYGDALDDAQSRDESAGHGDWAWPMAVVRDPTLTLDAKRSILMNWAWTEYLIDEASNEGMPENGKPSRLHEVEQALLALERETAADWDQSSEQQVA
jgi:hypothetical protein